MSTLSLHNPQVQAVAGRTEKLVWQAKIVNAADGRTQEAMNALDHVRFKLAATRGGAPILDLHSNAANANGSVCTIVDRGGASTLASGLIVLAEADTALLSGTYYWELLFIDVSEGASPSLRNKIICRGTIEFLDEQGGNLGAP